MSATVEDELITKFSLDSKSMDSGAQHVVGLLGKVDHALTHTVDKAKDFGRELAEKLKFGELLAPLAALATAAGAFEIGKDAWKTANTFDILERKLAGLTHSYARAQELEKAAEGDAKKTGLFNVEQLEEAELALEKFGLRAEKYLPIIEAIGAVSGDGLDQLAEAFGRLAGGDAGRGLMLIEKAAGIRHDDLVRAGVQFKGNELANPKAALPQIMDLVQKQLGPVMAELTNSPQAKAQALAVEWETVMRRMGQAEQKLLSPAIKGLTEGLEEITESGLLDRVARGFEHLFGLDGKETKDIVVKIGEVFEKLPSKIQEVEDKFKEWWPSIVEGAKILISLWAAEKVTAFATAVVAGFMAITRAIAAADIAAAIFDGLTGNPVAIAAGLAAGIYMWAKLTDMINDATDAMDRAGATSTKHGKEYNELAEQNAKDRQERDKVKKFLETPATWSPGISEDTIRAAQEKLKGLNQKIAREDLGLQILGATEDRKAEMEAALKKGAPDAATDGKDVNQVVQNGYLYQIAQNTHAMAKGFDKFAYGQGEYAKLGVTPLEIRGIQRGGGAMGEFISALEKLLQEHGAVAMHTAAANGYGYHG